MVLDRGASILSSPSVMECAVNNTVSYKTTETTHSCAALELQGGGRSERSHTKCRTQKKKQRFKYSRKQMGPAVSEYFNDMSKCLEAHNTLSQVSVKKASWSASARSRPFGVSCACCISLFSFLHLVSSVPLILAFSSVLTSARLNPNPTEKCQNDLPNIT